MQWMLWSLVPRLIFSLLHKKEPGYEASEALGVETINQCSDRLGTVWDLDPGIKTAQVQTKFNLGQRI